MRRLRSNLILLLVVAGLYLGTATAQTPQAKPLPSSTCPTRWADLLREARDAAPELAVDAMLRISARAAKDGACRKEILQEAFRTAGRVKYRYHLTSAYLIGARRVADLMKLDEISLKSRIIDQMLAVDVNNARDMVVHLRGTLHIEPRTCNDVQVFDVIDLYQVISKVASLAFDANGIAQGDRARFVLPWIEGIESPVQIRGAFDLVQDFRETELERELLLDAFCKAIDRNFGDDRSFTAMNESGADQPTDIKGELEKHPKVVAAYRNYLVKNMTASRCLENGTMRAGEPLPIYLRRVNEVFFPRNPLLFDEIRSREFSGHAPAPKTPSVRSMIVKGMSTVFKYDEHSKPLMRMEDTVWQTSVSDFLDRIESFRPAPDDDELDTFNEKAAAFSSIEFGMPDSALKISLFAKCIRMLNASSLQTDDFIHWYTWAYRMQRQSSKEFDRISSEYQNPNFRLMRDLYKAGL